MELNEALQVLIEHGKELVHKMHDDYHEDEDSWYSVEQVIVEHGLDRTDCAAVLLATGELFDAFECVLDDVADDILHGRVVA